MGPREGKILIIDTDIIDHKTLRSGPRKKIKKPLGEDFI